MGTEKTSRRLSLLAVISIIAVLLAAGVATYAWFTSNQLATTNKVTAKTNDANVNLLLDTVGGSAFRGSEECEIAQVNTVDKKALMPVSTDDLTSFVVRVGDGAGAAYSKLTSESNYFHGRIYAKAQGDDSNYGTVNLYLTEIDQLLAPGTDSMLLNAARLGLVITPESGSGSATSRIFYLSTTNNPAVDQARNTYLGGVLQDDNIVLHCVSDTTVNAVTDPAQALSSASVDESGSTPLAEMDINVIYSIDIYFYLEGCDPDCSDSIYNDDAELYLSFYGEVVD